MGVTVDTEGEKVHIGWGRWGRGEGGVTASICGRPLCAMLD